MATKSICLQILDLGSKSINAMVTYSVSNVLEWRLDSLRVKIQQESTEAFIREILNFKNSPMHKHKNDKRGAQVPIKRKYESANLPLFHFLLPVARKHFFEIVTADPQNQLMCINMLSVHMETEVPSFLQCEKKNTKLYLYMI